MTEDSSDQVKEELETASEDGAEASASSSATSDESTETETAAEESSSESPKEAETADASSDDESPSEDSPSSESEAPKENAPEERKSEPPEARKSEPPPLRKSEPPELDPSAGSVAQPIQAMRVIKLEASGAPPRPAMSSSPAIETAEASYEELEGELDAEELQALEKTPTPAPASADEISPDSTEEAELEEVDSVDELPEEPPTVKKDFVPEPPAAPDIPPADRKPPPPRRSAKPSLPTAKKPRRKPWWETLFGDDFSRAYRPMSDKQLEREVDFIVDQLGLPKGAVILDLGCGQGEICVELARRGYSVVGYDLSVFQLAMAGDNAQAARQKINFLQGDMREMAFEQMFDGVLCWDTSFGYFEEEKNLDVLQRVKKSLKPGGRFLLDVMNRDFVAKEAPYNHWFEGDGCVCMDDMSLDWITNRLKVKRSIILDDGRSKELQYSVRLYGLSDVGRMLHDVGFRVSAVSGDVATRGAFFGPASRRIIIQSTL